MLMISLQLLSCAVVVGGYGVNVDVTVVAPEYKQRYIFFGSTIFTLEYSMLVHVSELTHLDISPLHLL